MTNQIQQRLRSLFAMTCLLAVILLYAPLAAVAFSAYAKACCSSGQCPIKGPHQHHAPPASEHAMDCGHETPSIASCSMSCCHNPDRPALTPAVFVLPAPITASASWIFEPAIQLPTSLNSLLSPEPLSPPPRLAPAAV